MTTKATLSKDAKPQLDDTDKKILQLLQEEFPLVEQPWEALSSKLKLPETELFARIKHLCLEGVIQKIGPIVDSSKVGYTIATLVALRVPDDKVDKVAAVINQYGNISHNYEREHEYNVWFTIVAQSQEELTRILNEIIQKTGLRQNDVLNLPTAQRFKIKVNFQLAPKF